MNDTFWHCEACKEEFEDPRSTSVSEPHGDTSMFLSCPHCGDDDITEVYDCDDCKGEGAAYPGIDEPCDTCGGTGRCEV